jgi:hypothetical protein
MTPLTTPIQTGPIISKIVVTNVLVSVANGSVSIVTLFWQGYDANGNLVTGVHVPTRVDVTDPATVAAIVAAPTATQLQAAETAFAALIGTAAGLAKVGAASFGV